MPLIHLKFGLAGGVFLAPTSLRALPKAITALGVERRPAR
jgi:hypothetical protein